MALMPDPQKPGAYTPPWSPVAEAYTRYPGLKGQSVEKIQSWLSDPQNFRAAFPEYAHVPDDVIRRNVAAPHTSTFGEELRSRIPSGSDLLHTVGLPASMDESAQMERQRLEHPIRSLWSDIKPIVTGGPAIGTIASMGKEGYRGIKGAITGDPYSSLHTAAAMNPFAAPVIDRMTDQGLGTREANATGTVDAAALAVPGAARVLGAARAPLSTMLRATSDVLPEASPLSPVSGAGLKVGKYALNKTANLIAPKTYLRGQAPDPYAGRTLEDIVNKPIGQGNVESPVQPLKDVIDTNDQSQMVPRGPNNPPPRVQYHNDIPYGQSDSMVGENDISTRTLTNVLQKHIDEALSGGSPSPSPPPSPGPSQPPPSSSSSSTSGTYIREEPKPGFGTAPGNIPVEDRMTPPQPTTLREWLAQSEETDKNGSLYHGENAFEPERRALADMGFPDTDKVVFKSVEPEDEMTGQALVTAHVPHTFASHLDQNKLMIPESLAPPIPINQGRPQGPTSPIDSLTNMVDRVLSARGTTGNTPPSQSQSSPLGTTPISSHPDFQMSAPAPQADLPARVLQFPNPRNKLLEQMNDFWDDDLDR